MRYGITDRVLQLALAMQGSRTGLTLGDIERDFRVGRRTAQRMRDAILRLYPQAEQLVDEERRPRWRIPIGGVVAPGGPSRPEVADRVQALANALYPDQPPEIHFHPQCFLSHGHFAGDDDARADALVEVADDPSVDAVWFARGGYGSCRIVEAFQQEDRCKNCTCDSMNRMSRRTPSDRVPEDRA